MCKNSSLMQPLNSMNKFVHIAHGGQRGTRGGSELGYNWK